LMSSSASTSATGEPDWSRDLSFESARRSSAALNDDLVDIGDFQQFVANSIEAGSSKQPWCQTVNMRTVEAQRTSDNGNARHQHEIADRRRDDDLSNRVIGIDDVDHDLVGRPHRCVRD
jgi:hypothetical protein